MEDKISKFLIARKDGKLRYHKTDLLNRLFAIQNGINWETYTKNGGSKYCIVKDKLFAFGTTVFIGETLKGLILSTLKKAVLKKIRLKFL